eukprot:7381203-Prymnesium_polylepis.2
MVSTAAGAAAKAARVAAAERAVLASPGVCTGRWNCPSRIRRWIRDPCGSRRPVSIPWPS